MADLVSPALTVASILLLVAAALHDVATRTIPDWMPAALAASGLALRLAGGGAPAALAASVLILAAMAVPWSRGYVGGGDVKLTAAAALALPPAAVGAYTLVIALAGGVLALLYLALAHLVRRPAPGPRRTVAARLLKAEAWRMHRRGPLPYAVAIAAGGLFVLLPTLSG